VVVHPPKSAPLPRFVVTEQQQNRERLLEKIVHVKATAKPKVVTAIHPQNWLERILIPLLIFLLVLVSQVPSVQRLLPIPTFERVSLPVVEESFQSIESMNESQLAIVAFDFSPAAAGEMGPVAKSVVSHLMEKRVRILTVSTEATGPAVSQQIMDELAGEANYNYGIDYLNLGYITGGAAGLHSFATNPWQLMSGSDYMGAYALASKAPVAEGLVDSLRNVDLILVLTVERDDLRGWLEQVGRLPGVDAPIVAGTSASLESWALPYFTGRTRQLDGLVSGIPGAAQYDLRMTQPYPGEALEMANSQTVGLVVLTLVVTVGSIWSGLVGLARRRQSNE
jgi:hypothetical protein